MTDHLSIALLSVPFGPQRRDGIRNTVGKFAAELHERGHEVVLIQQRRNEHPTHETVDGVPVYRPYHLLTFADGPYRARAPLVTYSLAVKKAQDEFDLEFDVIHTFGAAPLTALRGILCRTFSDARVIFSAKAVPPNATGFGPRSFRYSRVLNLTDGVIASTSTIERHLKGNGCRAPLEVIPPNIDTKSFFPEDASELRDDLRVEADHIILYYGHFVETKGVDVLLNGLAELIERGRSVRCILAWSRGGDRDPIDRRIDHLGLGEHVDILPWEPDFPINRYVNLADVVVLPYRSIVETEAVPLCVVESMAAGRPVLSTRQSHLEDFFDHGEEIYLVEPESPSAIAAGLEQLLDSPELRQNIADEGRDRAQDFAVGRIVDRHMRWYRADPPE